MADKPDLTACKETRAQQAFMIARIVFMLVGIAAMLMGMYFSIQIVGSLAAFFSILRYGRKSSFYESSCGTDKSAPVCASVEIAESIVGTVDNIESASDSFAEGSDSFAESISGAPTSG